MSKSNTPNTHTHAHKKKNTQTHTQASTWRVITTDDERDVTLMINFGQVNGGHQVFDIGRMEVQLLTTRIPADNNQ